MENFYALPIHYFAACLHRLEETRGYVLSEAEYRALRHETLEELATVTRKPASLAPGIPVVIIGIACAALILIAPGLHPLWLSTLAAGTMICTAKIHARLRRSAAAPVWTADDRLEALDALRESRLVTAEEFSRLYERIELPRVA